MKRPCAVLAKVKSEKLFLERFWLPHYSKHFDAQDLHVHAELSSDGTEDLCSAAGVSLVRIPPGTVQHGKNNLYVLEVITRLLEDYQSVLFAESPDDVIAVGPEHDYSLRTYVEKFVASPDAYRFLTCYNVTHDVSKEPAYDPALGPLLSQRSTFIRAPQYDNSFLWKVRPTWGRGWHDLVGVNNGKRICGGGDTQGDGKRLYNLHVHYADFDLCNARHHVRQAAYSDVERRNGLYSCQVDEELKAIMQQHVTRPDRYFSDAAIHDVPTWMRYVV